MSDIPDNVKVCNCAECGRLLISRKSLEWWHTLNDAQRTVYPLVSGKLNSRPYCLWCLTKPPPPQRAATKDETSPWQENAIRDLEDTR